MLPKLHVCCGGMIIRSQYISTESRTLTANGRRVSQDRWSIEGYFHSRITRYQRHMIRAWMG
jgi:hypothetical protein